MNLQDDQDDSLDINVTPLIDVVFLLLIFFMVSTTFSQYSELQIELPEASAEAPPAANHSIEVSINSDGEYFIGGKKLINTQLDTLKRALLKAQEGRTGSAPPMVISADGRAPHQAVITAMDAARQAGLTRLSFATSETTE